MPGVGGWRWAMPPMPAFCVTQRKIYQHVGIFCVTRPQTPDASQWNIGGIGSSDVGHVHFMYISCTFHVHFMYISCCLCNFFRVGNAKISRRKGRFQWNTGFKPVLHYAFSLCCVGKAKKKKDSCFRFPDQTYFFAPTLKFFSDFWEPFYNDLL